VAARWRIRHKLMLGLGMFVGIMALLMGGTLRGLWSYYLTVNSIRSKLAELQAADHLEEAVHRLTSDKTLEAIDSKLSRLEEEVAVARKKLRAYEEKLRDTLEHGRDPGNGAYEKEMIQVLDQNLDEFEAACKRVLQKHAAVNQGSQKKPWDTPEMRGLVRSFRQNTNDLHNAIYDDLKLRTNESRSHYQITLWILVPTSVVGLVLVFGLGCSFYAWIFYPIRDLEASVCRLADGDFSQRIAVHSGDEMEDLGEAFNEMTGRLHALYSDLARQVNERSRQLVRSEQLASVGFLAAGVAHEINNPLASIAFCSEALEARLADLLERLRAAEEAGLGDVEGEEGEVCTRYLKMIQREAFRCKNITEKLLAFSRPGARRREQADLRELVQSVLDVTQHLQVHRGKNIAFDVHAERAPGGRIVAWVNAEEIKSVVLNLVVNALDSMAEGGHLNIQLAQRDGKAELRFTDDGCGMTREVLENIWEPFFTQSRSGKGTGLGLTISHRIITQHEGEIEASSPGPNLGSTFLVRLPVRPAGKPAASGPWGEAGGEGRGPEVVPPNLAA
jgi:two-component system NtrC family sensor kinase